MRIVKFWKSETQPAPTMMTEWVKLSNQEAARHARELTTAATQVFSAKKSLRSWVFENVNNGIDGLTLDFGVLRGRSTLQIASTGVHVFGFDSFEGLRDPWSKPDRGVGTSNQGGKVPNALKDNPNIQIVVGWVEDTLPGFLEQHPGPVRLAHLDMDVFPPTEFVLKAIRKRLVTGSLLVFDDYLGQIGWENHSYKAFHSVFEKQEFECVAISPTAVVFQKV